MSPKLNMIVPAILNFDNKEIPNKNQNVNKAANVNLMSPVYGNIAYEWHVENGKTQDKKYTDI